MSSSGREYLASIGLVLMYNLKGLVKDSKKRKTQFCHLEGNICPILLSVGCLESGDRVKKIARLVKCLP